MPNLFAALLLSFTLTAPAQTAPATQTPPPPSSPAATPIAPPTLVADPAVTAMALKIYAQMRTGKVDPELLTPEMNKAATPEILAQTKPMFDTLGDPKELRLEGIEKLPKGINYVYLAVFPAAQFHISLFITPEGKVGGYYVKP